MKVKHIYNACAIYSSQGATLLSDPWIEGSAFCGSWGHYPPLKTKAKDLAGYDYLFISHNHSDHLDPETLQHFDKSKPVIIYEPSRGLNILKNKLMSLGFQNIIPVKNGESYLLPPFRVTMYGPFCKHPFDDSQLGNFLDSSIVVEAECEKVLNGNDNLLDVSTAMALRKIHGPFRLAQMKDSSAGAYPSCFAQLSFHQKEQECLRLVNRWVEHALKTASLLDARFFQPFASQYRLQGKLSWKNAFLGISDPFKLQTRIKRDYPHIKPAILNENDEIDLTTGEITYGDKSQMDFLVWEQAYKTKRYPYELDSLPSAEDLRAGLSRAFIKLEQKQRQLNYFPDISLTIQVNDPNYYIASTASLRNDGKTPGQKITATMPARLLQRILNKKENWNAAEIGAHIDFFREPLSLYDPDFPNLMAFFHI